MPFPLTVKQKSKSKDYPATILPSAKSHSMGTRHILLQLSLKLEQVHYRKSVLSNLNICMSTNNSLPFTTENLQVLLLQSRKAQPKAGWFKPSYPREPTTWYLITGTAKAF